MASAVALALELLPCRKSQLGAQFSPTFHSTSTEMYACVNCGKVLRSQQGLNYHLAQKPTTCEKYLRKLSNQEKQASMVTQTAAAKSAVGNAAATQTGAASLSLAAKSALGNEVSPASSAISVTPCLPKPSSQVLRTIAPATQTAAAKSAVANATVVEYTRVSLRQHT